MCNKESKNVIWFIIGIVVALAGLASALYIFKNRNKTILIDDTDLFDEEFLSQPQDEEIEE